jgi:hypothetical protein
MKNLLLFISLLFVSTAHAQLQSNQVLVEGSFSYSRLSILNNQTNRFAGVSLSLGLMASQKTAVITGVNLIDSKTSGLTGTSLFSLFMGVRQFVPLTEKIYFFGQGIIGYGDLMGDSFGTSGTFSTNGGESVFLQVSPGLMFFPKPRFAVTARIGSLGYKFKGERTGSLFEINGGNLRLGLLYRFGG